MKVKQAKLAQAIRGETSSLIDDKKYDLDFDKGMLHAKLKVNPKNLGPFIIFPANIAYIEYHEEATEGAVQAPDKQLTEAPKGKPKK